MTPPIAVYDACVLYSAPLRDVLVRVALADLVRAHWTDQIHDEWTRNVLANRPELSAASIARTRGLMDAHVQDALVIGYEDRIPLLTLPDPDDRHVLAAAVHCSAAVIVTFNLSDFPADQLSPFTLEAVHPDEFLMRLIANDPRVVGEVLRQQRLDLKHPPVSVEDFLPVLEQCGVTRTVAALRLFADSL